MTIKDFAALCSCSTQTLRDYDRIGLLWPAEVDAWTGYRYYKAEQAVDFVKIKNFQLAEFSIAEIRQLLKKSDQEIAEAFTQKIRLQEQKLARILEIQRIYLKEKNTMEQIVHELSAYVLDQIRDYEGMREFGMDPKDGPALVGQLRSYLEKQICAEVLPGQDVTLRVDEQTFDGKEAALDRIRELRADSEEHTVILKTKDEKDPAFGEGFASIWEASGWEHVRDFIGSIPELEDGGTYALDFRLKQRQQPADTSFALFMLGAMLMQNPGKSVRIHCCAENSNDGMNRFRLLKK